MAAFKSNDHISIKGCSYDNAIAESTFKSFKKEFVKNRKFDSLKQLKLGSADYVHWFNHCQVNESLDYFPPIPIKKRTP
ncbi:IS3 family transposase [Virgibacillus proomii]|uniref:IS3 family transposase n=1 Tax=Virgibacillus proomii TaxID=84407 RepID=UPI001C12531F|nr:IS3 family transposase [Virgibacillus proomii]MBU5266999.1 IS3 family transposase [Virgibacillus proomii]